MKLVRHFFAVLAAVGLVIALGFTWSASAAAGLVADDRGGAGKGGGFSLSNVSDLIQTLVILALITAVVVFIDRARRRHKPIPRPTASARIRP